MCLACKTFWNHARCTYADYVLHVCHELKDPSFQQLCLTLSPELQARSHADVMYQWVCWIRFYGFFVFSCAGLGVFVVIMSFRWECLRGALSQFRSLGQFISFVRKMWMLSMKEPAREAARALQMLGLMSPCSRD